MKASTIQLLISFAILTITIQPAISQRKSSLIPPQWLTKYDNWQDNTAYSLIVAEGKGESLGASKQSTFANMTTRLEAERGLEISSTLDARSTMTRQNSGVNYDAKRVFNVVYKEHGKVIEVRAKVVDEYWVYNNGEYLCSTLYAVANDSYSTNSIDDISVTAMYGCRGLWRSALVPGWGQMYKGSKLKGGLILGGVALSAIAAVYTDNMAADYYSKMSQTYDTDAIRSYKTKGDQFVVARNVSIGAACALYLYNIIDAVVAPGARRIKISRKGSSQERYVNYGFSPSVSQEGALAMSLNLNF